MSKETKPAPKMSAEKETSSVQLLRKIYLKTGTLFESDFERAEEMHKKEILIAHSKALPITDGVFTAIDKAHDYYNETFQTSENG